MRIREISWFERLGARLIRSGLEVLSDAELLTVVLGRGSKEEKNKEKKEREVIVLCWFIIEWWFLRRRFLLGGFCSP